MSDERPLRAVVVDDDACVRESTRRLLDSMGVEVTDYASAHEVLEHLNTKPCDLVVSDYNMPGMDGMELLRRIRLDVRFEKMPIIILTGDEIGKDVAKAKGTFAMKGGTPSLPEVVQRTIESLR